MTAAHTIGNLQLQMAAASDVGQIRERNEDAIRILPQRGLAILSDGMGGHQAGDVAARMAVEIVAEELTEAPVAPEHDGRLTTDRMVDSLRTANDAIRAVAHSDPQCHGMGATIVVVAFVSDRLLAAHLGDSRLYRYWNSRLQQLTEDHTLAQQYVNEGVIKPKDAKTWVGRNMLVKGLGIEKRVEPAITLATLQKGQTYLLCSDGLTDAVSDDQIARLLGGQHDKLEDCASELIEVANRNGGPDNISVILTRVLENGACH